MTLTPFYISGKGLVELGMYSLLRPFLFRLDPEQAHKLTLNLVRLVGALPPLSTFLRIMIAVPAMPVQAFGLTFSNPIGLAAGYDKDGLGWRGLACLGFGHIEVGTVTPLPQPGNPQPRIFRIPEQRAIINRMGFPGRGADFVAHQLKGRRPPGLVLGVNLGKNKDTPLEEADRDYISLIKTFAPLADYLAINVSSPNTVGLRRLQGYQALGHLLTAVDFQRKLITAQGSARQVPVLVKLAPDLTDAELEDALDAITQTGMDGVIATNTTLSRNGLCQSRFLQEDGGLSGTPLCQCSTEMVRKIYRYTQGKLPIIGVGGIMCAEDVREKQEAGASLVQVYTGLVYTGPGLVKNIVTGLIDDFQKSGAV
jgi:dihydroorotate dehydrogenase